LKFWKILLLFLRAIELGLKLTATRTLANIMLKKG